MEEYKEIGNGTYDAFDAPNASAATTTPREKKYEELSQNRQMMP